MGSPKSEFNTGLKSVDIRIIFDDHNQLFVLGCHKCTAVHETPLNDVSAIVRSVPEFCIKHLQSCREDIT